MDDVTTLVSGIDFKVRKLIAQQKKLRNENATLTIDLNQLKKANEEQKQVIKGLEEKIQILRIVKMSEGKEHNSDIKAKINELVREIDKCIGLLNT
ncbi:MAG: hypothetical protein NTY96_07055 [Bacteroidetes bacterium]|nr:hypothetical protein [Bacteroidota bacterium]